MSKRPFDVLTPREREVLALLGHGLTNEEIAHRLGISPDGAKYHVSQILSKLGVATREEAAALALGKRRRWWAHWPLWAKIAGAATVASAAVGLTLLAWGVVETRERSRTPSETGGRASGFISWMPGQVIHTVMDLRGQGLDGRAESTTTNNEESWKLVGPGDNTQKARVFLRDETGRLLQEGFTDAESKTTVNRQAGVDHRIDRPAQQSVFMWTTEELQDELLNAGFVLAKQTSIAGLNANVYEKTILASGCPMLPSATHVVQDAYISVDPSGLDLGEQAVCSNDDGESTLLSARILRTIEVLEASSVPEGVFNWREAETTAP